MSRSKVVVVLAMTFVACSSDNTADTGASPASTGGSNNGGAINAGGQATQGGASTASSGGNSSPTQNCPPWSKEKLFPIVGTYFYGPNPGPCTVTTQGAVYTVTYNASNKPIRQATSDNVNVTTYAYTSGLLTSETDLNQTNQTNIAYQYSDNVAGYTSSSAASVMSTYTYTLDAQGYPQSLMAQGAILGANSPTRYQFVYDNCRIIERVAYLADNTESTNSDLFYSYDSQGRISERKSALFDETYDYSCW
jgi:hypothetical protein